MTKAVDLYDLAEGYDSLADGVRDVAMPLTLVSYEPDWRDPPDEIAALARAIATHNPAVTHHHLQSDIGHGAFQFDVSAPKPVVRAALDGYGSAASAFPVGAICNSFRDLSSCPTVDT